MKRIIMSLGNVVISTCLSGRQAGGRDPLELADVPVKQIVLTCTAHNYGDSSSLRDVRMTTGLNTLVKRAFVVKRRI